MKKVLAFAGILCLPLACSIAIPKLVATLLAFLGVTHGVLFGVLLVAITIALFVSGNSLTLSDLLLIV
jgi:hypothetical protein